MAETSIDISTGGVTQSIVAFDAICMIVDLTCIGYTAALVHRGRGRLRTLPLWTTLSCLIAWILYLAFDVIEFVIISTNQDPSSVISNGGQNAFVTGFQWLATCLTFHVLYALIHLMLDQTQPVKSKSKSNTPWRKTRVFHRISFAVIVVAACLSFAMLCARLYFAYPSADFPAISAYGPIQGVAAIVVWFASIENMAWSIHVGVWYPRCLGGHILPTLLLITAAIFWSISNCLIAIEISFTCIVTTISVKGGTIFDMSLIAGGSLRILLALSRIMYWAAIVVFCFRYSSIQNEGGLGSENDEALDSLNQKQDGGAEVEVQMVCYEADSNAYIAELPGDYNQVCEAGSHQIAEVGESEKFELPDFQSLDVKEKDKKVSVAESVKL